MAKTKSVHITIRNVGKMAQRYSSGENARKPGSPISIKQIQADYQEEFGVLISDYQARNLRKALGFTGMKRIPGGGRESYSQILSVAMLAVLTGRNGGDNSSELNSVLWSQGMQLLAQMASGRVRPKELAASDLFKATKRNLELASTTELRAVINGQGEVYAIAEDRMR